MLKISEIKPTTRNVTLKLEGKVVGPWVEELRQICEALSSGGSRLELELADVSFADEPGVNLLTSLKKQGARLLNAPPFVEEQLRRST